LVCFHPRRRTFLKLVMGRRVVGSVNDVLREWHIRRPFRRFVDEQTLRQAVSLDLPHVDGTEDGGRKTED
jgi:hypothetical protein